MIHQILSQLSSRDVAALALTCRFFKALSDEAIPDLKLSLYPHQVPPPPGTRLMVPRMASPKSFCPRRHPPLHLHCQ